MYVIIKLITVALFGKSQVLKKSSIFFLFNCKKIERMSHSYALSVICPFSLITTILNIEIHTVDNLLCIWDLSIIQNLSVLSGKIKYTKVILL